jgi:hypothetical protein
MKHIDSYWYVSEGPADPLSAESMGEYLDRRYTSAGLGIVDLVKTYARSLKFVAGAHHTHVLSHGGRHSETHKSQ